MTEDPEYIEVKCEIPDIYDDDGEFGGDYQDDSTVSDGERSVNSRHEDQDGDRGGAKVDLGAESVTQGDLGAGAYASPSGAGYGGRRQRRPKGSMPEKRCVCVVCGKRFFYMSLLDRHMTSHTLEKKFKCDYCEKVYLQNSHLRTHLNTHTMERKFICDFCQRCFYDKSSLVRHVNTHMPEKKFKCPYCPRAVSRKSSMACHIVRVHKSAPVPMAYGHEYGELWGLTGSAIVSEESNGSGNSERS